MSPIIRYIVLIIYFFHFNDAIAQKIIPEKTNPDYRLFEPVQKTKSKTGKIPYEKISVNGKLLKELGSKTSSLKRVTIEIEKESIELELNKLDIISDHFFVQNEKGEIKTGIQPSNFYSGKLSGEENGFYVLSVTDYSINGMLVVPSKGTFIIEPIEKATSSEGDHKIYKNEDLDLIVPLELQDYIVPPTKNSGKKTISKTTANQGNPIVKIHFVADQDLYLNKGSVQNTVNYISGFFAAVAALYERAGMYLQISGITVYENPDGFPEDSADEALSNFRTTFNPPNGDLAHLVALDNGNGGIAYLDVLCNENYKFGYSDIYTAYNAFTIEDDPSSWLYSWTVGVVAHELGHNIGAPHTHDCFWTLNNIADQAIDICGFEIEGLASDCGGTLPDNGGTIMSYCNQIGNIGINFSRGFHPLVQNLLFNSIQQSPCLEMVESNTCEDGIQNGDETGIDCGGTQCPPCQIVCEAPIEVHVSVEEDLFSVSWDELLNSESYNVRARPVDSTDWDIANNFGNGFTYVELMSCTNYEFQIQSNCLNSVTSDWSAVFEVQTTGCPSCEDGIQNGDETGIDCGGSDCGPCEESCEPPVAPQITTTDSSMYLIWSIPDNAESFDVRVRRKGNTNWITGNNLDNDAFLNGLQKCTEYEIQIKSNCSFTSSVWGEIYTQKTIGCVPCVPPVVTNYTVTDSSASVWWLHPEQASHYNIRVKNIDSTEYLYGYGFGPGFNLYDLFACTDYEYEIQSICNSELSPWSSPFLLQTTGCFTCEDGIQNGDETGIDCGGSDCEPCILCEFPEDIHFTATSNHLTIGWSQQDPSQSHNIRYQKVGGISWNLAGNVDSGTIIDQLIPCTEYQFQVQTVCQDTITSEWSPTVFATTLPPSVEFINAPVDTTVMCDEINNLSIPALAYDNGAVNQCAITGTVSGSLDSNEITGCGDTLIARWVLLDSFGRSFTHVQHIFVEPAPIPYWIDPPLDTILSCEAASNFIIPDLQYTNGSSGDCLISGSVSGIIDSNANITCGDTAIISWSLTDSCGALIEHQQEIIVLPDPNLICPEQILSDILVGNNNAIILLEEDENIDSVSITLYRDSQIIDELNFSVEDQLLIPNLDSCSQYQIGLVGSCEFEESTVSDLAAFETLNCEITSVKDFQNLDVKIYPNPFYHQLTIENNSGDQAIMEVISPLGILIKSFSLIPGNNRIDVSEINSGVIFIRLHNSKGNKTLQLIKMNN
jgi:hypothetical protein